MKRKVRVAFAIISLGCILAACNVRNEGGNQTEETVSEEAARAEYRFGESVKITELSELKNYDDAFDSDSIQAIHLDDLVLTKDEFFLTNKKDYTSVIEKVSEGRESFKNIAGDISVDFSDFTLKYTSTYDGKKRVGITISVEPISDTCRGFYIECPKADWYITDSFWNYTNYLGNSESKKIDQEEQSAKKQQNETEYSDLKKQIKDFKDNINPEQTTQDLLRGVWRSGDVLDFSGNSYATNGVKLEKMKIWYDSGSKYSKIVFTNDEFMVSYDNAELSYGSHGNEEMEGTVRVSGVYRVTETSGIVDEGSGYSSIIELLITDVSPKFGVKDSEAYDRLNQLIGKNIKKSVDFGIQYCDLSNLSDKKLAKLDLELHEKVTVKLTAEFGFRSDGSYGLIYYDTPIIEQDNPFTTVHMNSVYESEQLISPNMYTKTKYSLKDYDASAEPGICIYDVLPKDDIEK